MTTAVNDDAAKLPDVVANENLQENGTMNISDGDAALMNNEELDESDMGEEEDDDDDMDDVEEEPKLRYKRIGGGVQQLLGKDTASTIRLSNKFMMLGTHWGAVHIVDFEGNVIKSFQKHVATVNDISIDQAEEFVASASDDGKIFIYALYATDVLQFNYRRPVKSVALDPAYTHKSTKQFVSGGMAEQLIMSEKSWLGHKDVVLHANEGPIYSIQWRNNLIAWANDAGVKIYDTTQGMRITYIDRPPGSPRADQYRCNMCWKDDTTLLIGWADIIKVAVVKHLQTAGQPTLYVEIVFMCQTDYIVCGIAPFNDTLLVLAYILEDDINNVDANTQNPEKQKKLLASRPELHIINKDNEEISADVLSMHGYEHYQANDYALEYLVEEDMFYVMGPKDLIVARSRDQDDHIDWLLDHEQYGEALNAAREAAASGQPSKRFNVQEIGQTYLNWLVKEKQYKDAAAECRNVLGNDKTLWEDWVFRFTELGELKEIAPFIPTKDPQLSSTVYEISLASFLKGDHQALLHTLHQWPRSLYNISNVIVAVEDYMQNDENNELLLECLADLYTYNNQPDKAIEYNLRLRRPNAFDLIQEYNMFDAVKDKAVLLLEFDQHLLEKQKHQEPTDKTPLRPSQMPAVQLLVKNTDALPPKRVVKQLQSHRYFLHIYLDALFDRDANLGHQFHDSQVELYADYDYPKLLDFLRASHYISLEKAYAVCEKKDLVPEMVFILGRMGDNKKALMLIIERLGDVQMAIDFAKEQKDEDLWEDLLTYSMDKPNFIRGLLENVGTDIPPLRLIQRIPDHLDIPGLKNALLKILVDYNLQLTLHEGCEKILVSDSVHLAERMYKIQKRGVFCAPDDMVCGVCNEMVFDNTSLDEYPTAVVFFCRHAYHEQCLLESDTAAVPDMVFPVTLATKMNHAALLTSARRINCPRCREQAEGGNAFMDRMRSQKGIIRKNTTATTASQLSGSSTKSPRPSDGNDRSVGIAH